MAPNSARLLRHGRGMSSVWFPARRRPTSSSCAMDDTLKPAASGEDKKDVEAKAFFEKNKPSIKDAEKLTWDSLNEQAKELWRMRAENRQDESPPDAFTSVNELSARSWAE